MLSRRRDSLFQVSRLMIHSPNYKTGNEMVQHSTAAWSLRAWFEKDWFESVTSWVTIAK